MYGLSLCLHIRISVCMYVYIVCILIFKMQRKSINSRTHIAHLVFLVISSHMLRRRLRQHLLNIPSLISLSRLCVKRLHTHTALIVMQLLLMQTAESDHIVLLMLLMQRRRRRHPNAEVVARRRCCRTMLLLM